MTVYSGTLKINTRGNADIQDITVDVESQVRASGIKNGIVTIFSPSSTSSITTIEFESGAVSDLRRSFDVIANPNQHYAHNARWGDGNGHSHVRASLLGAGFTIPIIDGRLKLGTWQQIIFIDFDVRPRSREIIVQIVGE